jgi:hypothetical protein
VQLILAIAHSLIGHGRTTRWRFVLVAEQCCFLWGALSVELFAESGGGVDALEPSASMATFTLWSLTASS